MFEDFEDFEQQNDIELDSPTNVLQQILSSLEDGTESSNIEENLPKNCYEYLDGLDSDTETLPENFYEYLDSINAEYIYEKQEMPDGVVKESLVWETRNEAVQDVYSFYNIKDATDTWHVQKYSDSCAIACQEFILEEYTDQEFDEDALVNISLENGWVEEGGTPVEHIGNILEYHGIETYTDYNAEFQDLENVLNNGDRAIVGVFNMGLDNDYEGFYPAWSANHAIEVIGIDKSNPEDIKVIVNDPGVEDGCGKRIDYDVFMKAWDTSGGFMVVADRP